MSMTENMTRADALEILGLTEPVTPEDAKAAYKSLSKKVHPDVGGNDFLFKMTHQAYEILLKPDSGAKTGSKPQGNQHQNSTQNYGRNEQKRREPEPSWYDLIHSSGFHVPFDDFTRVVLLGETAKVFYRGYNVNITPDNVEMHHIKSSFPIDVEVRSWKSFWGRLFHRKPIFNETRMDCRNTVKPAYDLASSRHFGKNMTVTVPVGYHEVTIKYLGRVQTLRCHVRKAFETKKFTRKLTLNGNHNIHVAINVTVTTKM